MTCVAAPVSMSWAQHLPHAAASSTVTWTATFDLFAPLPAPASASTFASTSAASPKQRPTLRLPLLAASDLPARRFDPFADEPVASTSTSQSQNTPPARGRALTPLVLSTPTPAPAAATPLKGRRRAPSFSAGSGSPRSTCIVLSTPAPASLPASAPSVPGAPTPFHARHYPTPDARARLLARTLLNRIHAVGRPRSPYFSVASSPYSRSPPSSSPCSSSGIRGGASRCNGTESECGRRGYVPSRLSECVAAC